MLRPRKPYLIFIRSTGTVHTSAKASLISVTIRIHIQVRIRIRNPDVHQNLQNLTVCSSSLSIFLTWPK